MNYFFELRGGWSKIRPLCVFTLLLVLAGGCSLPEAPGKLSWDTHLTVPLGVRTYGLWDLRDTALVESSGVDMTSDSSLYFFSRTVINDVSVRDSLYFEPLDYTIEKHVTALFLPITTDRADHFSLGQLNPAIGAMHNTTQTLPPHSLQGSLQAVMATDADAFTVDSGTVWVQVKNTLQYGVTDLVVSLQGTAGSQKEVFRVAHLASGDSSSRFTSLGGFRSTSVATLVVTGTGDGGTTILVDSTSSVRTRMVIDTVQVSAYAGIIPQQVLNADSLFHLDQQHDMILGTIESCTLTVIAANNTQIDDSVWVVYPNLINPHGDSLVSSYFLHAGEQDTNIISLTGRGYRIIPRSVSEQIFEGRLISRSVVKPEHETFIPDSSIKGTLSSSRIYFSYFNGTLHNLSTTIPEHRTAVQHPPEGWTTIHPTDVNLYIQIDSSVELRGNISLHIESLLNNGIVGRDSMILNNVDFGKDTVIVLGNLAPLIAQYPDTVRVYGTAVVNGTVAVYNTASLRMTALLEAPLSFTMEPTNPAGEVVRVTTEDLKDIQSGTASFRIWNRLPMGGRAFIVADRDSAHVRQNSGLSADTIAQVDIPVSQIVNGRATGEAYTEFVVSLDSTLLDFLKNPPFFTRTDIWLPGSNGDTLIAHGSDFLKVQVRADVTYKLSTEDN